MTMRAMAIVFSAFFGLACGEVMSNEVPVGDGSIADSSVDADSGTFACGTTSCRETELCVYPPRGCVVSVEPPTDAGTCSDGTSFADVVNGCVSNATSGPPPYCWSPGPSSNALQCSGADGSVSGFVDQVPGGSGHVCYATCV